MARKLGGFGHAIDYDKAIAQDEAQVRRLEQALSSCWFTWGEWVGFSPTLANLVLEKPEAAAALDLSAYDLGCLALLCSDQNEVLEARYTHHVAALPKEVPGLQWRHARAIEAKLVALWPNRWLHDEPKLREELKLHKARLARHLRNKAKHG